MAYIPPLNGGRLNASIGGNSTSAGGGYSLISTGNMILAGGNNITLSQNANSITISGGAGGGAAIAGGGATYSSGTANLIASGALTITSINASSLNFSVPQTSSLQATGAVSISTNGGTISIGAPAYSAGISNGVGNTSGTTGFATNQLVLAGGNNVTLSQATGAGGNTITISAGAAGGSINFSASNTSANLASVTFSNSNGLSFGLNAGVITASHNGITSQTNQTLGLYGLGNTTQNTSATLDARNLSFNGLGAMTVGYSGSSIQLSAPVVSSVSATGIVSISSNGSTVSIGAPAFSVGVSSNSTVSNQMILAAGNNISLSQSTNATGATISINATNVLTTQSYNPVQFTNSTANSTMPIVWAGNSNGSGNVTMGLTGSTMTASAPSGGGGGGVVLSDGVNNISSGTASFADGGGINFAINGQTVSANASLQMNVLNNTTGGSSTATLAATGMNFSNYGAISAGFTGSTMQLSVPTQSNLSATGAVSISTNGNTISIGAPAYPEMGMMGTAAGGSTSGTSGSNTNGLFLYAGSNITMSQSTNASGASVTVQGASGGGGGGSIVRWEYPTQGFNIINAIGQSSLSMQHIQVPYNVTGSALRLALSFNISSLTSSGTTGSVALSLNVGLYSLNGPTLSSIATGSTLNSFSFSSGAYVSTAFNGIREVTSPLAVSLTPGDYWVGALLRSATSGSAAAISVMGLGLSNINTSGSIGVLGVNISQSARDVYMGQGIYTANTAAAPASIPLTAINNTVIGNMHRAAFYHAIYSATY